MAQSRLLKYGKTALIAGASEGLGAAYAKALAEASFNLVLVARRQEPLEKLAKSLIQSHAIDVQIICCDLAAASACDDIVKALAQKEIDFFVYNACASYIGPFLKTSVDTHIQISNINMITPLKMIYHFGGEMVNRKRGAIVMMASMAGLQGSGFLSTYGASKAFDRILAEGLWYEWKNKGVDIIACCAGATATPNYLDTKPRKTSMFEPKAQAPEAVVEECLQRIGSVPSYISGRSNRLASFFMQKLFPRKSAVQMMGQTTEQMYAVNND